MSLYLGSEIFDICRQPLSGEFSHLFVRQGESHTHTHHLHTPAHTHTHTHRHTCTCKYYTITLVTCAHIPTHNHTHTTQSHTPHNHTHTTHTHTHTGTGLQGQAVFRTKVTFRPHSTNSQTHRKMTLSIADRFSKTQVHSLSSPQTH